MRLRLPYLFAAFVLLAGCDLSRTVAEPIAPDSGGGDSDTDSDSDSDSDSDTDSDTGSDTSAIPMDCSDCPAVGADLDAMLCAIDLCDTSLVERNEYERLSEISPSDLCSLEDTYEAVTHFGDSTNDLASRLNGSYALMATGPATGVTHSTWCFQTSGIYDDFAEGENTFIYDAVEWSLVVTAPEEAEAFRFKYVFFSEEYDDFIGAATNDMFYVMLEAGSTNLGEPTVINFTYCRNPSEHYDFECDEQMAEHFGCVDGEFYCYLTINSALSECCWYQGCPYGTAETDISGTGFECAEDQFSDGSHKGSSTGWLQTAWPIDGGETFKLTFHIHDTLDGIFDSEVIIDAFQFLTSEEQGTVVIE
jgi:hypothetical protein